jgi:hypothetical protein
MEHSTMKAEADNTPLHPNLETAIQRLVHLNETLQSLMKATGDDVRPAAEKLVEELIGFLDANDPDPDFEDDTLDNSDDAEREEDDPGEDNGDREPSLGSLMCSPGYTAMIGDVIEYRKDAALGYVFGEKRSSLGSQENWAGGGFDDREDDAGDNPEEDPAEAGLGDADAMMIVENEPYLHGDFNGSGYEVGRRLLTKLPR